MYYKTLKNLSNYRISVSLLGGTAIGASALLLSVPFSPAMIGAAFSTLISFSVLTNYKLMRSTSWEDSLDQTEHGRNERKNAFQDGELAAKSYAAHFTSFFIPRDWKYYRDFVRGMERGEKGFTGCTGKILDKKMQEIIKKRKVFHDGELAAESYTAYFKSFFVSRDWKYSDDFKDGMKKAQEKQAKKKIRVAKKAEVISTPRRSPRLAALKLNP